jgi:bacillithiol synthase
MILDVLDTPLGAGPALPDAPGRDGGFGLAGAVLPGSREAARRLAAPGALAVTTGQQPGLFTGPLLTIHKALSARAVAATLERRWGRPVVPVFWVAADDHDHAEGSRAAWLSAAGDLVTGELPARDPAAALLPMYREPLPGEIAALLERFEASVPPGESRDATVAWLRRHYRPGATLGGAFGNALAELLGPLGIVCVDGSSPDLKRAAWPVVRQALADAPRLDRLLAERHEALVAAGADPGVRVGDGATLVMLEASAGRDRLLARDGGFVTRRSGERFSLEDLEAIGRDEAGRLSANVLLRPVVESAVLPTVAYVAGPGELRYLALAAALYAPLGVSRQVPVPRWSGILVEPRVPRTLGKLGLALDDVLSEGRDLEQRLAREALPAAFEEAVARLRASLAAGFDGVVEATAAVDPTLRKPALAARAAALAGVGDLEKRVLQAVRRQRAEAIAQLERVLNAVRPEGRPQERVLGLPGYLARYGPAVTDDLAAHVAAWYEGALVGPAASP